MRFLFAERAWASAPGRVTVGRDAAHRLASVLRLRPGDEVELRFRDDGSGARAVVESARGSVVLRLLEELPPPPSPAAPPVALGVSLLRHRNLEVVAQKATELGVERLVPLVAARCVARSLSAVEARRLRDIVDEACQQCGRVRPMAVAEPRSPAEFAAAERAGGAAVVALSEGAEEAPVTLEDLLAWARAPVACLVGPEGGFAPEEVRGLRDAGALVRHLPGHVLRAETAALVAAALMVQVPALAKGRP